MYCYTKIKKVRHSYLMYMLLYQNISESNHIVIAVSAPFLIGRTSVTTDIPTITRMYKQDNDYTDKQKYK